jgi:hypothetical protein
MCSELADFLHSSWWMPSAVHVMACARCCLYAKLLSTSFGFQAPSGCIDAEQSYQPCPVHAGMLADYICSVALTLSLFLLL